MNGILVSKQSVDSKENLIVCDFGNNRLQMMTRDGKWQPLQCDKEIYLPMDAVGVGYRIFAVGGRSKDSYMCMLAIAKYL